MSSCEPSSCEPRSPRGKTTHQHRRRCHHRFLSTCEPRSPRGKGRRFLRRRSWTRKGRKRFRDSTFPKLGSMGAHHHPSKKKQPPWLIPAVVGGGVLVCLGVMAAMLTGDWGQSKQAEQSSAWRRNAKKRQRLLSPRRSPSRARRLVLQRVRSRSLALACPPGETIARPGGRSSKVCFSLEIRACPTRTIARPSAVGCHHEPIGSNNRAAGCSVPDQPTAASSHASEEDKPSEALTDRVPVTSPSTIGVAPGGGLGAENDLDPALSGAAL